MTVDDDRPADHHAPTVCVVAPTVDQLEQPSDGHVKPPEYSTSATTADSVADSAELERLRVTTDGGWGWVVAVASFFSNMIVDGVCYSFGLLYTELLDEFNAGRSKTALVGSLVVGTYLMIGQSPSHCISRSCFIAVLTPLLLLLLSISIQNKCRRMWCMWVAYNESNRNRLLASVSL